MHQIKLFGAVFIGENQSDICFGGYGSYATGMREFFVFFKVHFCKQKRRLKYNRLRYSGKYFRTSESRLTKQRVTVVVCQSSRKSSFSTYLFNSVDVLLQDHLLIL